MSAERCHICGRAGCYALKLRPRTTARKKVKRARAIPPPQQAECHAEAPAPVPEVSMNNSSMDGRAKNNTPWRGMGSLQLPNSPPHLAAPDQQLQPGARVVPIGIRLVRPRVVQLRPVEPSPELDQDAIAIAVAQEILSTGPRRCTGKKCNAVLSRYNLTDLCNACQARGNQRRA